jgi:hypothetical protein
MRLSSGWKRLNAAPDGVTLERAFSFSARLVCRYPFVVSMLSCPSQSAMTEMSTPASSKAIAVPCRTVLGEMRFFFRLVQCGDAASTAFCNRSRTARRLSGSPRIPGNAMPLVFSRSHSLRTRAVEGHSGIARSLRPLPCRWRSCSCQCRSVLFVENIAQRRERRSCTWSAARRSPVVHTTACDRCC